MIYIVYKTGSVVACPLDQEIELLAPFFIAGRDFDGFLKPIPSMTDQETLRALNPASIPFCSMQFRQPEVLIFETGLIIDEPAPADPVNPNATEVTFVLTDVNGDNVPYYSIEFADSEYISDVTYIAENGTVTLTAERGYYSVYFVDFNGDYISFRDALNKPQTELFVTLDQAVQTVENIVAPITNITFNLRDRDGAVIPFDTFANTPINYDADRGSYNTQINENMSFDIFQGNYNFTFSKGGIDIVCITSIDPYVSALEYPFDINGFPVLVMNVTTEQYLADFPAAAY